jgi:hypothetical protein
VTKHATNISTYPESVQYNPSVAFVTFCLRSGCIPKVPLPKFCKHLIIDNQLRDAQFLLQPATSELVNICSVPYKVHPCVIEGSTLVLILKHSLTHPLIHSLTHSLTHTYTHSHTLNRPLNHVLTQTRSITQSLTPTRSLNHTLLCSFSRIFAIYFTSALTVTELLTHSITCSLTHIRSVTQEHTPSQLLVHSIRHSHTHSSAVCPRIFAHNISAFFHLAT